MKSKIRNTSASLLALAAFALSTSVLATNGYFTHGVGAESKAMAGMGIGSNAEMGPIIVASNPALAVFADECGIFEMIHESLLSFAATSSELLMGVLAGILNSIEDTLASLQK